MRVTLVMHGGAHSRGASYARAVERIALHVTIVYPGSFSDTYSDHHKHDTSENSN